MQSDTVTLWISLLLWSKGVEGFSGINHTVRRLVSTCLWRMNLEFRALRLHEVQSKVSQEDSHLCATFINISLPLLPHSSSSADLWAFTLSSKPTRFCSFSFPVVLSRFWTLLHLIPHHFTSLPAPRLSQQKPAPLHIHPDLQHFLHRISRPSVYTPSGNYPILLMVFTTQLKSDDIMMGCNCQRLFTFLLCTV